MAAEPCSDPETLLANAARVRALARALVSDVNEARDIEQTAWRRALESGKAVESPQWLATIVRNVARSRWRDQTRRVEREQRVATERGPIPTPAEVLQREELRRDVVEHVLALEDPWRTTIVLHYLEERSLREVAEAMGVSLETARTRSRRGLELLRQRMKRERGSAWSSLLIRGFDLEPNSPALPATLGGIVAVGTAAKFGVLVVAGVAALATLWTLREGAPATPTALEGVAAGASVVEKPRADLERTSNALATREEVQSTKPLSSAPPSSATIRPASVLVRVLWAEGRAPASDVWIELWSLGDRVPELQLRRARTNRDGEARFDGVSPGRVLARSDRGLHHVDTVMEAEQKELELVLEPGFRLVGDVVDELAQPVAGAEIWVDDSGPEGGGFCVATSDAEGRFEVRDLGRGTQFFVGARAAGRAPTLQHFLNAPASDEVRVRLAFTTRGASLRVVVRASDGEPVSDASVYLGNFTRGMGLSLPDGSHGSPPAPLRARTNEAGEAQVDGVAYGPTPLQVRAPDFAPWSGEVEIGRERSVVVGLERGAVLRGRVVDADGRPVSNARVSLGNSGDFSGAFASSKRDGTFALYGLPAGEFKAFVHSNQLGSAERTFVGAPGVELEWTVTLAHGQSIVGRILAPGMSVDGWCVAKLSTRDGGPAQFDFARVDGEGRFRFLGCDDTPVELAVRESTMSTFTLATVRDVRPSEAEVLIEIDPARRASVRLRGRVVDESGAPLTDAEVHPFAFELGASPVEHVDPATGRFELGPYPSGDWGLVVIARGRSKLRVPPRRAEPDSTLDFGDIALGAGAVLALSIARDSGVVGDEVEVDLYPLDAQLADSFRGRGPLLRSHALEPGRYEVRAFTRDGVSESASVEVVSGRETPLEIRLRPAASWSARIEDADGRPWSGQLLWHASDKHGEQVAQGIDAALDGKLVPRRPLPAGALRLVAQTLDGSRVASAELAAGLSDRAGAVALTLR
jgi:RNA polymerase sigma-70 factor (ECF subfamily)